MDNLKLESPKKYNVYIISTSDFKAVNRVGLCLGLTRSKIRAKTYELNINPINHFVGVYEVGSDRDKECENEINSK